MDKRLFFIVPLILLGVWELPHSSGAPSVPVSPKSQPPANFDRDVLPFLAKHCFACHGNGKKRGGFSLEKFTSADAFQHNRKVWENVLQMVRTGEMPPRERARPPIQEVAAAVQSLDTLLGEFDCTGPRNVGRVTLRRLNRVEYNNTIRNLVGVTFKPADDFPADDVGYGFDNIGDVLSLSPLLFEKYLAAAESILDQAIVIADPPKPAPRRLGGLRVFFNAGEVQRGGAYLHSRGFISGEGYFDEGDYHLKIEAFGQQVGDEPVRAALRVAREEIKQFEVKAERSAPVTLETTLHLKAGTSRISVSFLNPYTDPNATDSARKQRRLYVRSIVLDGPYNPPPVQLPETHRRIMAHRTGLPRREEAREIITRFAAQAFRRPVKAEEVERYLKLFDQADQGGERFEQSIRLALSAVLVSPHFLFRVELDPPDARAGATYLISEYELASRLSYFLWSSMPDAELFDLAARGRLRKELPAQVRRMLQDPRSAAFVQNFAGQWLTLRNLATVAPDHKLFPTFDEALRSAMYRETELFFETILREDRSILDLLDADFSFVNERLAKHYGIPGIVGEKFQRVTMPVNRRGILTHGSILTLTSNPTRTAPVKRGKWILEQILNSPPPPPPPDVPDLPEVGKLTGSLRQVMEQHRQNAICASCHQRMDPIGFAFENFDAVGAWRDRDGKFDIDPSGVLPDGRSFKGPGELKVILKDKKELFGRCLAEKLLTYALGRGLEFYDKCAVDRVLAALEKNNYRFSTLLVEVIQSEPFQMRTATGGKR
jgi:hypothetical protein